MLQFDWQTEIVKRINLAIAIWQPKECLLIWQQFHLANWIVKRINLVNWIVKRIVDLAIWFGKRNCLTKVYWFGNLIWLTELSKGLISQLQFGWQTELSKRIDFAIANWLAKGCCQTVIANWIVMRIIDLAIAFGKLSCQMDYCFGNSIWQTELSKGLLIPFDKLNCQKVFWFGNLMWQTELSKGVLIWHQFHLTNGIVKRFIDCQFDLAN
jgi:hypothetical protein